ncbi:MAG TPA: PAS domain S-box protein [Thermodesulfobacteriaceae bacterium]|nr:PAS domain S-box protein [Thermodesulfobacteriaceae bacterium]
MTSENPNTKLFLHVTAGRLVVLAFLLGAAWLYGSHTFSDPKTVFRLSMVMGGGFFLAAVFLLWNQKRGAEEPLLWTQTAFDVLLAGLAVFWTGGSRSPLVFLFPIAIIAACLLGGKRHLTASAVLSTVCWALICWSGNDSFVSASETAHVFFINMAAFNTIALLGGILAQRLCRAEEKLSEARTDLQRMEEVHRHLANSIRSGLITVDEKGRITTLNTAAMEILQPGVTEIFGQPLKSVWPAGALSLERLQQGAETERMELRHECPEGDRKILGISVFEIRDEVERSFGYGIIFQDITRIKAEEERRRRMDRMATLGEIAAGLAHEIRNPLASLSGAAQFLQEGTLISHEGKRLLEIICRESARINELTETFLMYAIPEPSSVRQVSVREKVRAAIDILGNSREMPEADITIDVSESISLRVDPKQFEHVLINLLANAYNALPRRGGQISVLARRQNGSLLLSVSDNGSGIKEEHIDKIFHPFFTTFPDETGLGLSIVQRLVNDWHGEIAVKSERNRGTTFTLKIPV